MMAHVTAYSVVLVSIGTFRNGTISRLGYSDVDIVVVVLFIRYDIGIAPRWLKQLHQRPS